MVAPSLYMLFPAAARIEHQQLAGALAGVATREPRAISPLRTQVILRILRHRGLCATRFCNHIWNM